jgi:hypothetical protein
MVMDASQAERLVQAQERMANAQERLAAAEERPKSTPKRVMDIASGAVSILGIIGIIDIIRRWMAGG